MAAVLVAGVAMAASGVGGIRFKVVSPVTVQALGLSASNPAIGETVTAGAKLVAERDSMLPELAIAVTGPDGKRADFPHVTGWKLGTSQKVFSQSKSFDQAGKYTYWITYKKNSGRWIDLNPKQSFIVGDLSTVTPDPTTPGATPSPSASTTTAPTTAPTTPPAPSPTSTGSTGGTARATRLRGQPRRLRLPDVGHDWCAGGYCPDSVHW